MPYRVATIATAALLLSTAGVLAADLPTYEVMGFPATQHQLAAVNSAYVQESSPVATLTLAGMPASPVQILIMTPIEAGARQSRERIEGGRGVF